MSTSKRSLRFGLGAIILSSLAMACSEEDALSGSESNLTQEADVIFSPANLDDSHIVKIAQQIGTAKSSVDVAIYSFNDKGIFDALAAAVERGCKVRVIYNSAGEDNRKEGEDKAGTLSARLEAKGVEVRFINKIMHHKFVLIDGPRDDLSKANDAILISGSANWDNKAATKFDENTLILPREPELALRYQREYDNMWNHARDFDTASEDFAQASIPETLSVDDPDQDALFTSKNFSVKEGSTTFKVTSTNTVADALAAAIRGAKTSVHLASGHMRSRIVADALKERAGQIDVKVYLDGQEFISDGKSWDQKSELQDCLADAADDAKKKTECEANDYLFGRELGEAGVDVRYKFYAYRWDFTYAPQMHHKYMVIDGETLYSGSYNLSDNAEHATFENMMVLKGQSAAGIIAKFEKNFSGMFETGREKLEGLQKTIETADTIPIVFDSMALTSKEIDALKEKIRSNCSAVDSTEFRQKAASHQDCKR